MDRIADTMGIELPKFAGMDARSPGDGSDSRVSRTSNYLALLGGPRSAATFMFDPQDKAPSQQDRQRRQSERMQR